MQKKAKNPTAQIPQADLYKLWCRIFFSDYTNQNRAKVLQSKRNDRMIKLQLHVPILNMICDGKTFGQMKVFPEDCLKSTLDDLAIGRLIIKQEKPKEQSKIKLNPNFLEEAEKMSELIVEKLTKEKLEAMSKMSKFGDTSTVRVASCTQCNQIMPESTLRQYGNINQCYLCHAAVDYGKYEPDVQKQRLSKCEYLLAKLERFKLMRQKIDKQMRASDLKKEIQQNERKISEINSRKFNQILDKVPKHNPPKLSQEEKKSLESILNNDHGKIDILWNKLRDERQWMKKLDAIRQKRLQLQGQHIRRPYESPFGFSNQQPRFDIEEFQ